MKLDFRTMMIMFFTMLFATGCSSVNVWPFGDSKSAQVTRGHENATEFRCEGSKTFHVRYLDAGKSAWVILPDRQVRLDQVKSDAGSQYTNGIAVLRINGAEASLNDGPTIVYSGCKAATTAGR